MAKRLTFPELFSVFLFIWIYMTGCGGRPSTDVSHGVSIDSTTVVLATFFHTYTSYGEIQASQSTDLDSRFNGTLQFNFTENLRYHKGDLIFSLSGSDVDFEHQKLVTALEVATANFEYLKKIRERNRTLKNQQLISAEDWEKLQRDYQMAVQEQAEADSAFQYFIRVTQYHAPYDGILTEVQFNQGEYVEKDALLARFLANRALKLVGQYYGDNLKGLQDPSLKVLLDDTLKAVGHLIYFGPAVDPETGGREFWIELNPLKSSLIAGIFVKFRLLYAPYQAVAVPDSALIMEQGQYYVVTTRDGSFSTEQVKIGEEAGSLRELRQGPPVGTLIVTRGAFEIFSRNLQNSMKIKD